jgi:hypothetical protein
VLSIPKDARRRKSGSRGRNEAKSDQKRKRFRHPKNKYLIVVIVLFEGINLADLVGYHTDSVFFSPTHKRTEGCSPV